MSKNPGSKREIIELSEVPRSSTPEPVPKRPKASRSTSKVPARDSRARGVIVSAAGTSEPGGSSIGRPARTPAIERSSERPSGEVHASDIASGSHAAIGAHPPVDRASTDVLETDGALTEPRRASRSPSAYRASTETDTEVIDPVMNNMAGGPSVDRTPTGGVETLALTSAHVAEEPRGDPIMVESFTPRVGAATQDSKVEQSSNGQGRPPVRWGQGIQRRPSTNLPQTSDSSSRPTATLLLISPAEVSEAISKLQREKARIQRDLDQSSQI
jgi:hypothetical protein